FLQHANNLLFGESLLHDRSSSERTLHRQRTNRGEQVSTSIGRFYQLYQPPSVVVGDKRMQRWASHPA
ncbi:hypothetical protein LBW59_25785, partial [Ralstonia solanacearum]